MKRFFVDAMLGKVAIWLRLTGHDTRFNPDIHDDEILEIASVKDRIILTSDEELVSRADARNIRSHLVRGSVDSRVAEIFRKFNISTNIDPEISRCTKCNGELRKIDSEKKAQIKDMVKRGTYENHELFWLCKQCGSIFWEGSHWKNMVQYMKRITKLLAIEFNHDS
ncbi:MAG: hypothetical protein GF411_09015 [Candidatus Lokiarchaeota archaeon]|nr:hypothetical protein [Candidatus Lokiarchaeota archaeon]